jgi:hypothetical protein
MDGNFNGAEMVEDLESMKEFGLGNLIFLEVNIGLPRGPVDFMSDPWQQYPWSMKNQGDWAFCMGINRFVDYTFATNRGPGKLLPSGLLGPVRLLVSYRSRGQPTCEVLQGV